MSVDIWKPITTWRTFIAASSIMVTHHSFREAYKTSGKRVKSYMHTQYHWCPPYVDCLWKTTCMWPCLYVVVTLTELESWSAAHLQFKASEEQPGTAEDRGHKDDVFHDRLQWPILSYKSIFVTIRLSINKHCIYNMQYYIFWWFHNHCHCSWSNVLLAPTLERQFQCW